MWACFSSLFALHRPSPRGPWPGDRPSSCPRLRTALRFHFYVTVSRRMSSLRRGRSRKTVHPLSEGRTLRTVTYRDPVTQLEVSREITVFPGKNAVEWVLRLRNAGSHDSPMLKNILPLDLDIPVAAGGAVTVHHVHGSRSGVMDYVPVDKDLGTGTTVQIAHYII